MLDRLLALNHARYEQEVKVGLHDNKDKRKRRRLALLAQHSQLINCTRPGGRSLYTVLHQAAHGGAPVSVVEQLLGFGAWRTLRTARGERPLDIAERQGQTHLHELLEPALKHQVPLDTLQLIQQ